jgi:hypothetical protein
VRNFYNRRMFAKLAVLLLFSGLLLLVPGCSKNTVAPTASTTDNPSQQKLSWLNQNFAPSVPGGPQKGAPLDSCPILKDTVLVGWIGIKGGSLELKDDNGKISFDIPAYALYRITFITIHVTKYSASFGPFYLLNCGPSGTAFAKPLEVMPTGSIGKTRILYYYNEKLERWEIEEVAGDNQPLEINHFSNYAISE